jgi:hypothetical protein
MRAPRLWEQLRRHRLGVALAVGVVAAVAPLLTTRVYPFHDSAGIVGLGGALALRDDPTAAIRAFYDLDIRAYPSALYFGWAYLAGALGLSIETAFAAFIAILCIAALPLATWLFLRAFQRPQALALLVFPISYHHQIWYGFLGSSAAIAGLILALAFARRIFDRPSWGNHAGLAAALLYVAAAHPFPLALTLAVVAPLLVWPPPGVVDRRRVALLIGARLGTLVPTAAFLGNWTAGFFGRRSSGRGLLTTVRTSLEINTPAVGDAGQYLDWLGNGYQSAWDALVPGLALATLALLLAVGVCPREAPAAQPAASLDRSSFRRDWIVLGWAAAVLLLGYLLLPMKLVWPELWWGVRVRCVVPSYLVLLALVRPRARGLRPKFVIPAYAAALIFFAFVTVDFAHYFRGRALAGFDQALAAIPRGQSVLGFPVRPDPHYTLPHPYLVQHHVARAGGRAVPHLRGHAGSYWITMKPPPDSPPWGDPGAFDWAAHAAGWNYFLIEQPLQGPPVDPMRAAPPGAVRRVSQQGQWEVWQNLTEPSVH